MTLSLSKNRYLPFLKMFALTGILSVNEIIFFFAIEYNANYGNKLFINAADAVKLLAAIYMFATFCWKKKV